MTITLYDATVRIFSQGLEGLESVLRKGLAHCEATGADPDKMMKVRLIEDMLPLAYQVQAAVHHSIGAVESIEGGVFIPDMPYRATYAEMQAHVAKARMDLAALDPETVNALAGRDAMFKFGEREMPFEAANFLMTFSLPNFYFHAATAYDILRSQGVPLAKRDFMGTPRMKLG